MGSIMERSCLLPFVLTLDVLQISEALHSPSKMTSCHWRCLCQSHCLYLFSSKVRLWSIDALDSTSWSEDCCWQRSQSLLLELQQFTGRQGIYRAIGQELIGTASTIALHSRVFEFTCIHSTSCHFPKVRMGSKVYRGCTLTQPAPPISVSSEQIRASAREVWCLAPWIKWLYRYFSANNQEWIGWAWRHGICISEPSSASVYTKTSSLAYRIERSVTAI